MNLVSLKRLVLLTSIVFGSLFSLPVLAWPDTDEMNMCGNAVKNVQKYAGAFKGWEAHDIFIDSRGADHYFRNNCPESTATKNYKGRDWTPKAEKLAMKNSIEADARKILKTKKSHDKTVDCIRVDKMNNSKLFLQKANYRLHQKRSNNQQNNVDYNFYRQAQAVLNMGKSTVSVNPLTSYKKPKHKKTADCIRTDGLNSSGTILKRIR